MQNVNVRRGMTIGVLVASLLASAHSGAAQTSDPVSQAKQYICGMPGTLVVIRSSSNPAQLPMAAAAFRGWAVAMKEIKWPKQDGYATKVQKLATLLDVQGAKFLQQVLANDKATAKDMSAALAPIDDAVLAVVKDPAFGGKCDDGVAAPISPAATPASISTPAPTVAPVSKGDVGQTKIVGAYKMTVNNVETNTEFGSFAKAKSGNIFVAVEVTIESLEDTGVSVNPFFAKITDSDGHVYEHTLGKKVPGLKAASNLGKGKQMSGWLTVEIPKTAKGLTLIYKGYRGSQIIFDLGL